MDYLDLKYALAKKGYTLTRVAEELGLFGPQSVQQVLTRKYISARVEKRVSEITGIPLEKMFPDRYHATKRHRPAEDSNAVGKSRGRDQA
jgi:lambda repressor-like predicted transcriptional regulator